MSEAERIALAPGEVVVFSARAPDKASPNEDAALLASPDGRRAVLVVADGMGGRPGGESASQLVCQALARQLAADAPEGSLRGPILDAVEAGNRAILELGIGAATTLGVAELVDGALRAYHVGDAGILVVGQRGRVKLETVPHSPTGYAVHAGLLDADEALHHEERHLVSNAVGAADMRIEVGSPLPLAPRDTLLLATDGLFDNLSLDEIIALVRAGPLLRAARALVERCRQRMLHPQPGLPSKPDDLTFLLFRRSAARRA